jgi:hypothetical protein
LINPEGKEKLLFYVFAAHDFAAVKITDASRFVFLDMLSGFEAKPGLIISLEEAGIKNYRLAPEGKDRFEISFEADGKERQITYYTRQIEGFTPKEIKNRFDVLKYSAHWAPIENFERLFGLLRPGGFIISPKGVVEHRLGSTVRLVKEHGRGTGKPNIYQKIARPKKGK